MMSPGRRIVVVGAGLTGGIAAATLREDGFDGDVTLIGAEAHPPYERPPLSKSFLRGETPFEETHVRTGAFWSGRDVTLRLGTTVESIDTDARSLRLSDGDTVAFDLLLLATGARNRRFPIPGIDLPGVFDLRTVDDAERIREAAVAGSRAAVVGMGFIGSEVAASLRSRGVEVTALEQGAVPLARVLGEDVGRVLAGIHADRGVTCRFGDGLASFDGSGRVETVVTASGARIDCDFAVVGMGVQPNVEIANGTPLEVDNGVVVDERCRTNVEGVFAAGDVANHYRPMFGTRIRVEHWDNARRQGRAAARSMLGSGTPYDDVPWFWSDQYDQHLQYAGFHREWDDLVVRGSLDERGFVAFYLKDGVPQAAVALNRNRELRSIMPMLKARGKVPPATLRDEDVDLASLAPN
jgi:3-phenylpropionate/trans-cinnamate dioxygenase ferredoxin reductase subunit